MQLTTTTLSLLSLFLSATIALPQTIVHPGQPTTWEVTDFTIGCSPGGCVYNFDLAGPATADVGSAFSTHCTGTDVQNKFVGCDDTKITANLVPENNELILYATRTGPATVGGPVGYMEGNATAQGKTGPVLENFSILARFYGDLAEKM